MNETAENVMAPRLELTAKGWVVMVGQHRIEFDANIPGRVSIDVWIPTTEREHMVSVVLRDRQRAEVYCGGCHLEQMFPESPTGFRVKPGDPEEVKP